MLRKWYQVIFLVLFLILDISSAVPVFERDPRAASENTKSFPVIGTELRLVYMSPSPFEPVADFPSPFHVFISLRAFYQKLRLHQPQSDAFPKHEHFDAQGTQIDLYDRLAMMEQGSALTYETAASVIVAAIDGYTKLRLDNPQRFRVVSLEGEVAHIVAFGTILQEGSPANALNETDLASIGDVTTTKSILGRV